MIRLADSRRPALFVALVFGLVLTEWFVTQSAAFARNPHILSLGVLFDLTVITSGLFFWLIANRDSAKLGGWSVARQTGLVALLMARVGLFMLPVNTLAATLSGPALLALIEGGMLIMAGFRIQTIVETYRQLRPTTDANTALQNSLAAVFGQRAAGAVMGEWLLVRYALLGWQLKTDVPVTAMPLTTHRESGQVALTAALGGVGLIELMAVHLLLTRWSVDVAFWVTLVSIYGMLVIVADVVATLKRPSYLTAAALHLRLGVRWRAVFQRDQIKSIITIHEKPTRQADLLLLNAAFLTTPNVLITLREPVPVNGLYGLTRSAQQIALFVDEPENILTKFGANGA